MGYSIKATLKCQGECRSCYENRIRKRGIIMDYDIGAILRTLDKIIENEKKTEEEQRSKNEQYKKCEPPTLHGGEPLLINFDDLKKLVQKIHSFWRYGGIQTNGLRLTDEAITLFKEHNFHIGISLDGDTWQLNQGRWNAMKRSPGFIQKKTDLILENMRKARVIGGLKLSCIIVLRKYNASKLMVPELLRFIKKLYNDFGITSGRTNIGIVYEDKFKKDEELTSSELAEAYIKIAKFFISQPKLISQLQWHPYHDIIDMMFGYLDQTCVFNECDVFHTRAEQAINNNGHITNCLHSGGAIEGIQLLRADNYSTERSDILFKTPQAYGGCAKCRYWHICYGGCPGEGIDNDWRNRTRFCAALKKLFYFIERSLKNMLPNLLLTPEFYPERPNPDMVQKSLRANRGSTYRQNIRFNIENIIKESKQRNYSNLHGDRHGDEPHGDHTDL